MSKKEAVLVVSFGTSHQDTLEKNISAIEREIASKFPGITMHRAFTSGIIMKILKEKHNTAINNTAEALEHLANEGYTHVTIQPTHIMNGDEYEKMCAQSAPYSNKFEISFGRPLLTTVEDYKNTASAVMASISVPEENEAIIFMGHGTGHYANAAYSQFEYILHDLGWKRAFVGTVEGYPELDEVIRRLKENPAICRVRLYPLMIVAGDHAKNDMAGDEEDSWKSILEQEGYKVSCVLQGLGEMQVIREIFAEHALSARGK